MKAPEMVVPAPLLITESEMFAMTLGYVPPFSTIVRLRKNGQLPPCIKISRRHYYRVSTIAKWMDAQERSQDHLVYSKSEGTLE